MPRQNTFSTIGDEPAGPSGQSAGNSSRRGSTPGPAASVLSRGLSILEPGNDFHILSWSSTVREVQNKTSYATPGVPGQQDGAARPTSSHSARRIVREFSPESEELRALLSFLWNGQRHSDRRAFKKCPQMSRKEVHSYAKAMGKDSQEYELYTNYKDLMELFLPPDLESPLVTKYWGAVTRILLEKVS